VSVAPPRRILVRCPNPVGDAVMATPAFRALRRAHPRAEIALLGPARNASLLRGLPFFDEYLPIPDKGLRTALARVRALRARHFDWAVLLPDSPRSALDALLAGIPRRVGYARDLARRALLSEALDPPREGGRRVPISMIERYLRITRHLGCADAGERLELVVGPEESQRAALRLAARGVEPGRAIALVTPGAGFGASKLWPAEHFARAGDLLLRRFGLLPVVVPAPDPTEVAIAREIAERAEEPCVALEPGSLGDLVALVARSRLVLTNDTGPRHVAVALDRPVVVVMGPTDPRHTHHLMEHQRVLREDLPCSPCGLKVCPIDHRCMTRLAPERVVEAAAELLA
jgi:lipopolysaccharide heptosyltransferase II